MTASLPPAIHGEEMPAKRAGVRSDNAVIVVDIYESPERAIKV